MTHEHISFNIRAGLERNEWTLLIGYPDRAEPFVTQATGSRDDAIAAAHRADRCLAQEATSQAARKRLYDRRFLFRVLLEISTCGEPSAQLSIVQARPLLRVAPWPQHGRGRPWLEWFQGLSYVEGRLLQHPSDISMSSLSSRTRARS